MLKQYGFLASLHKYLMVEKSVCTSLPNQRALWRTEQNVQRHVKQNRVPVLPIELRVCFSLFFLSGKRTFKHFSVEWFGIVSASCMCVCVCANQVYTKCLGISH